MPTTASRSQLRTSCDLPAHRTVNLLGRFWGEISAKLALDPEGLVAHAMMSRDTWSAMPVRWPMANGERIAVELSGIPAFDRAADVPSAIAASACCATRDHRNATPVETPAPVPTLRRCRRANRSSRNPSRATASSLKSRPERRAREPSHSTGDERGDRRPKTWCRSAAWRRTTSTAAAAPQSGRTHRLSRNRLAACSAPQGRRRTRARPDRAGRQRYGAARGIPGAAAAHRRSSHSRARLAARRRRARQRASDPRQASDRRPDLSSQHLPLCQCRFPESGRPRIARRLRAGRRPRLAVYRAGQPRDRRTTRADNRCASHVRDRTTRLRAGLFTAADRRRKCHGAAAVAGSAAAAEAEQPADKPSATLAAILDIAADGIVTLDRDGTHSEAPMPAPNGCSATRRANLSGRVFGSLFAPESERVAMARLERLAQGGEAPAGDETREIIGRRRQGGLDLAAPDPRPPRRSRRAILRRVPRHHALEGCRAGTGRCPPAGRKGLVARNPNFSPRSATRCARRSMPSSAFPK